MLKIFKFSDTHLYRPEFCYRPEAILESDVVVSCGDLANGRAGLEYLKILAEEYPNKRFIAVLGNHEFWGESLDCLVEKAEVLSASIPNLNILHNSSVVVEGIKFIGGTLWTSLKNDDPLVKLHVSGIMKDYKKIRNRKHALRFTPEMSLTEYYKTKRYIFEELEASAEPCIVLTHHKPYLGNVRDLYGYAYQSDMSSEFMSTLNLPEVWFYGHTHESDTRRIQYSEGGVLFVSNPKGHDEEGCLFRDEVIYEI